MPLFTITAWCDRAFTAKVELEAETPEAALDAAMEQVLSEDAEECDSGYDWDQFRVCDVDDNTLLTHQDEQARLREAGPRLLAALQAILPYAEAEALSLDGHKDGAEAEAEAIRAWKAVEDAQAVIGEVAGKAA